MKAHEQLDEELEGGKCQNPTDLKIWKSGGRRSFDSALNHCGRSCAAGFPCTQDCMKKQGFLAACVQKTAATVSFWVVLLFRAFSIRLLSGLCRLHGPARGLLPRQLHQPAPSVELDGIHVRNLLSCFDMVLP